MTVRQRLMTYRLLTALAVLAVGLPTVYLIWWQNRQIDLQLAEKTFELQTSEVTQKIEQRMNHHAQILLGGLGLYNASKSVEREEWQAYVEQLQLAQNFPGLLGMGYAEVIKPADLNAHIAAVRAEGFPDYTIRPEGKRDLYTAIVFIEPFTGRNLAAFGYDMFSEPTRQTAMRKAVETGRPTITGKVTLVQENQGPVQAGFLMYLPVYRKGQPLNNSAERWNALQGFVYSPFRVTDLMQGLLDAQQLNVGFALYDGTESSDETRMHATDDREFEPHAFSASRILPTYGRIWTVHLYNLPDFIERSLAGRADATFWLPASATALVLMMTAMALIINRQRMLAQALAADLDIRNRAIVDTIVDGIVTVDEAGKVATFNPAAERIFGYAANEVVGQNIKMLMPGPARDDRGVSMRNYVSSGMADATGNGREVAGRRKDGSVFPMDLAFSEMEVAGKSLFTGIIRDVTERVNMETAQRDMNASLERLVGERTVEVEAQRRDKEQLLNAIGEGLYRLNLDGLITFINPAGARILGYEVDELIDQHMHSKCHHTKADGQSFPAADCPIYKTLKDGQVRRTNDDIMWRKDGTKASVEHTSTPVFDEKGKLAGATVVFRDVTERRALESQLAQAQKMEAVGQLTGGIAHDFNNMLSIIIGNLDLAVDTLDRSSEERPLIESALNGAMRGANLVKQLMAFSRRQTLTPTISNLNEQITKMEELLDRALGETITVKITPAPDLWPTLVDPAQLESAILNLAINARDAMPNGGRLTIATSNVRLDDTYVAQQPTAVQGEYVCISISDEGNGMPPEVAARVFEPFFTTKASGKGTGLVLSMVYGFVKQSGGQINVYSEVGYGTTFNLYFPRAVEATHGRRSTDVKAADMPRGTESILLVEDNPGIRVVAQRQLTSLGYHVQVAENGPEALNLLSSGNPVDLLFTDIVMPAGMSGFDLAQAVRQIRPDIKILYTSGFHAAAMKGNVAPHLMLAKPYRVLEMAQRVRAILDAAA